MKKDSPSPRRSSQAGRFPVDRSTALLGLALVTAVALGGYLFWNQASRPRDAANRTSNVDEARKAEIMAGGKYYKPLFKFMDAPGIDDPEILQANQVDLRPSREIIGVTAGDKVYALLLEALVDPHQHVVNLWTDEGSVSVTYCDLQDCIRVLESPQESPVPLRIGGLNEDGELVLLLNGERYDQTSPDVPLVEIEYARMTWGEWKELHPDTLVYVGEVLVVRR